LARKWDCCQGGTAAAYSPEIMKVISEYARVERNLSTIYELKGVIAVCEFSGLALKTANRRRERPNLYQIKIEPFINSMSGSGAPRLDSSGADVLIDPSLA
jgi:hypothetical protein